ncbi:SusC/RagA family TonB-linked outer membrane protein [Arachidicoccus terrestris]|uniref:SusC/RagA family TonB-linked outer membrane protein n=1 Tax=Arachidicoccus terrestris TaxID=2875539 RepID=UPI001CC81D19|nr:SusC/RagA family TonB-linked outer membrane protein [Arachidicoccus terrestris]UAY53784.1 SusC/RagA family TonB-linked outer membrane protein [Arachidicoccus terrestris]
MTSKRLSSRLVLCMGLLLLSLAGFAQTKTITGNVTNEKGNPVSGASIKAIGTTSGTFTSSTGDFELDIPGTVTQLEVSYVGYATQTVSIAGLTTIKVQLQPSADQSLDEVVVIGYGQVRKKDLTGSVASIGAKDFNKGVITAPDQLIQGKTPGVMIINNTGQPGGSTTVKIRGNSSIRAGNNPLFVLDGIPLSGTSARPGGSGGFSTDGGNPLTYLNPSDIASIDILKDASATAIYGSRGANGVVIITTKRAKSGEPTLTVAASGGVSKLLKKPDVLDAGEFRQAIQNYTPGDVETADFGSDVDAFQEITRTAPTQNYYGGITGGTENGRYRLSVGFLDQKGIIKTSDLKKYTANLSSNFKFLENKRLGLDLNLLVTQTNENLAPIDVGVGFTGNVISQALQWNPTRPLYDANGNPTYVSSNQINPMTSLAAYKDKATVNTIVASISPYYKITDNLEYKLIYSVTRQTGNRTGRYIAGMIDSSQIDNGMAFIGNNTETDQQLTQTVTYNKEIADGLNLNAVAGYEFLDYKMRWNSESGSGFTYNGLDFYDYLNYSTANNRGVNSHRDPSNQLQSFFLRASFNYLDRYLLTATVRRDGSTKFGENNRYANFPSVAFAWNLSNEDFLKGSSVVDNLKLRLGWGQTGNSAFPSGASRDRFTFGTQSITQANFGNPDLKWEASTTLNAGIDFGFFQNRLSGSLDYFNKKTTDALFESIIAQPAPPSGKIWVNLPGEVSNQGFELSLTGNIISQKDLHWNLTANATYIKNDVSGLTGYYSTAALRGQGFSGVLGQRMVNDQPLNVWYLAKYAGIDPATGTSMYEAMDGTVGTPATDAKYDPALNKFYVGSPNPKYLLGISTDVTYKKFTATFNMNGAFGHYLFNNTMATVLGLSNLPGRNIGNVYFNPSAKESVSNSASASTRYLEKGDYMKMSNITLSYRVGDIGKSIKNLNISLTGQNLFVLTGYNGFDPEVNTDGASSDIPSLGIEYLPYPPARTILLGVNFSL